MPGIVFDTQSYALYDGPGIRTCVYLKGCPLRCRWCHNPESQSPGPEMGYRVEKCARCGRCVKTCPNRALEIAGDRVVRDRRTCAACGACADGCPNEAMERIGAKTTAEEILAKVLPDKPFYDNSGGGVTVSGGEPTFSEEFLIEILDALRESSIHTAIETCGQFPPDLVDRLIGRADLFLYDLKHMDPERHREGTGATNGAILENFVALLGRAGPDRVVARIPLIPGFNTDERSIDDIARFLKGSGYRGEVHLLPHHSWARGKYQMLDKEGSFRNPGTLPEADLERICRTFTASGFEPLRNG